MQNILVTGGAGFIGSSLADRLLAEGNTVVIIDNFDPFYSRHIKLNNLKGALESANCKLVEGDIRDKETVTNAITSFNIDTVIHLAAKAGVRPSLENPSEYYNVNVNGTLNILECMKECNVKKLIFASSSSVYGNQKVPFSEADPVDSPISPYASSKKSGELMCYVFSHLYGFDITCLRFFTVYGPRQRPDLAIHSFTRSMLEQRAIPFFGDGSTARDYTYIEDIVSGICCALNNLNGYRIYNLGESNVIYLKDLISIIEEATGEKAVLNRLPSQPGDVQVTYADISKARQEIGYDPQYEFKTGIENFVQWFLNSKKNTASPVSSI